MSLAAALAPNIDPTVEIEVVTWDFGPDLATGASVQAIVSTACSAIIAIDANATTRLKGSPVIVTPDPNKGGSGITNGGVSQFFGTCVAGVTYQLQCVVTTTDGQTLSNRGNITCGVPPGA